MNMSKRLRLFSRLWLCCAALVVTPGAWAQLLTDDFNATTLPYSLTPSGGWSAHSAAGTNSVQATAPTLTYAGLTTTGGSATLTTSGEDVNRQFAQQTSGSVYVSFLVNVASAQNAGDYFLHLGPTTIGTTFIGRVFVKSASGGIQFGVSKGTDTGGPVYASTVYNTGTTYLLVLKYTFVAGSTTNDVVDLFVQPALGQAEPTPSATAVSTLADLSNAGSIALRQGTAANAPGLRVDYIRIGTAWGDVTGIPAPTASLTASPASLTGFSTITGTPSTTQPYTLTVVNLANQTVTATAPTGFELGLAQSGPFAQTQTIIPQTNNPVSPVIYARLTGAATGTFSGTITNTVNSTLTAPVTVSGQTNAPSAPALTVSPTALTNFTATQGAASAEQSYTISAGNLTAGVSVSAPAGVEVSQTSGSSFGPSLTLPASTTSAVVYVRLTGAAAGPISGTITNVSGSLTANVVVSGIVNSNTPYTPIATARLGIGQSFTIAGRVTVSSQSSNKQFYVQDRTGGIAVYSGSGPDLTTQVSLGDSVEVSGNVIVFSGYVELTNPTGFTNVTTTTGVASRTVTPATITLDQLGANQGKLVRVVDVTIGGSGQNFVGNTGYPITDATATGLLYIRNNATELVGAGKPATADIIGVADRFVTGTTTTGTDNIQLQPRLLSDVSGATPAPPPTDQYCGSPVSATSTGGLALNQTFELATMNLEFFGAPAGQINCPSGTLYYQNQGPVNEALQASNVNKVLSTINADVFVLEEVSDRDLLQANLPAGYALTCSDRFSYYFQDECTQVPTNGYVFGPTKFAQKVCMAYKTSTVTPVSSTALLSDYYGFPTQIPTASAPSNWSSGRLPYLFVADATINGVTRRLNIIGIHAKSGSATADYGRRKQDVQDLYNLLTNNLSGVNGSQYTNANIIIAGDYNDFVTKSIASGQPSSYAPFVSDPTNFSVLTQPLEVQGCSSFFGNAGLSFLDHVTISNELYNAYLPGTVGIQTSFSAISGDFTATTSDHRPVYARFDLSKIALTAPFAITGVTTVSCQSVTTGLRRVTFTPQYSGLTTQPVTFSVRNETLPTTNPGPYSVNLYTDNPVITLLAQQAGTSGTAQFSYNWLDACNTGTNPPNTPPTVANPIGPQSATVNQAFSFAIPASTFTDAQTPNQLTLSVGGLPAGLSFTNGIISGTPSATGVSTVTVTATDPGGLSASTTFALTVNPATGAGTFAIVGVTTVSCQTVTTGLRRVTFTPQYSGLSGQSVTFSVRNESLPTTNPGPYSLNLYTDNPVVTLLAVQSGVTATYAYNWLAACNTGTNPPNTPPVVVTPIANLTVTVGQPITYNVAGNFSAPQGQSLSFSVAGLTGTGVSIGASTGILSGTFSTTVGSPFSVTVTATDPGGLSVSSVFRLTVLPASGTGPFAITGVTTVNCQTTDGYQYSVTFAPQYAGLNGQPVTFSVRNETLPTTSPGPYTVRLYRDNPVITLLAQQAGTSGTVQFSYNWLAACNTNGARAGVEQTPALRVLVLGNPVPGETVEVEVRGAMGQRLRLQTLDGQGHVVGETTIEQAGSVERARVRIGQTAGVYLLRVQTPTQHQVLKAVKQ